MSEQSSKESPWVQACKDLNNGKLIHIEVTPCPFSRSNLGESLALLKLKYKGLENPKIDAKELC